MQNESVALPELHATAAHRYRGAIWTLLVLAPVVCEVLSGSTRLSFLFVLIPEVMVWGCGALLCRELVRRWQAGGPSLLLLGLALSVAEEFIIQQTSIAPLPFVGANAAYGRFAGVNSLYFLFMLGFESVWVVLVPVEVTELLFPKFRRQPWLRKRGLIATCAVFLIGCRIAWYEWPQQARVKLPNVMPYTPSWGMLGLGFLVIALLIAAAYCVREWGHAGQTESRKPANPWLLGCAATVLSAAWWVLLTLIFVPTHGVPVSLPLAGGCIWALLTFALILRWSLAKGWSETHGWALSFGAILGTVAATSYSTAGWSTMDFTFKILVDALALAGLIVLALRVRKRQGARAEN